MTKKTRLIKPKKNHPFLFLIGLGLLIFLTYYILIWWQDSLVRQEVENISRSQGIESLLKGEFLQDEVSQKELFEFIESSLSDENSLNYSDDVVNLALREIFLVQGKNGFEQWRLKASWATLRENTSILNLNKPTLIYNTENNNQELNEVSEANLVNLDDLLNDNGVNKSNISVENFYENSEKMLIVTAQSGIVYDENTKLSLLDDVLARQEDNFVQSGLLQYNDETKLIVFPYSASFGGKNINGSANELTWDINNNIINGHGNVQVVWEPEPQ